jgi:hypothetical protein
MAVAFKIDITNLIGLFLYEKEKPYNSGLFSPYINVDSTNNTIEN